MKFEERAKGITWAGCTVSIPRTSTGARNFELI